MRLLRRAGLGLAALGLLVSATGVRAAVSTTTVRVSSGAAPFNISYILAQNATAMTINIRKVSDNSLVRALTSASGAIPSTALTQGPHNAEVQWNGATTGGAPAGAGDYYAEVVTTGAANPTMTALTAPVNQADPANSVKIDGRFYYGFDTNKDSTSQFHNFAFVPSYTNGNAGQETGVYVVNADCTTNQVLFNATQTVGNYIGGAVLSDGKIILAPQAGGNLLTVINPDGTLYKTYAITNATNIYARGLRAYGTGDNAKVWFIDAGSTGSPAAGTVAYVDLGAATITISYIVPQSNFPTAGRSLEVKPDGSTLWVYGRSAAWVQKWNNNAGTWTKDTGFTFTNPAGTPASAVNATARLSPDASILWIAVNDNLALGGANAVIQGVDPATGVSKGAAYTFTAMPFAAEEMAVTSSGNIYTANYTGVDTGTTGRAIALIAPPDSGSTDTTRSTKFSVVSDTTLRFATQPVVSNLTYHGCTITWDTNYACDSTVSWGSGAGTYEIGTVTQDSDPNPVTHHVVTIDNLEKATQFHYQVTDQETGFTPTPLASADLTFTTHDLTISAIAVNPLADITATISWTTNEPSTSIVHYGINSGSEDQTVTNTTLVTAHTVALSGLTPLTPYYFTVESGYSSGPPPTHPVSAEQTFTTLGTITMLTETLTADQTTATLGFTTNVACAAIVHWGTARAALTNTITVPSGTAHTAAFSGLTAGTTYYYDIDLSGTGLGGYTTPIAAFTSGVAGGTGTTVTHAAAADFGTAFTTNVDIGTPGSLLKLQKQGLPGTPVETTPLPQERYYHGCAVSNGYLYVMGGRFNADTNNTVDTVLYAKINADGTVGAWNTTTALPPPTASTIGRMACEGMCFGYNGYIYIVDAADSAFTTLNTVIYAKQNADGTLGAWQTSANLVPENRDLGAAAVIDGHVLLSGGEDNVASPSNSTAQYMAPIQANGDVGPWYRVTDIPSTRWFNKTVSNAHATYQYGGYNSLVWANQAQIAGVEPDGHLGNFTISPNNMTLLRYNFTAALVGGKILSVAGRISPNSPDAGIDYAKLMSDGSTGAWSTSGSPALHAVDAPDGGVWGNNIYQVGGRTVFSGGAAAAAVNSVQLIPMVPDTADPDGATYAYAGTVESSVIDLTAPTNLKHLKVSVSGGTVEVRYRFANADGIFSDWFTPSSTDADISGGARYFQYQLVLSGTGTSTPTVNSVALTTVAGVSPLVPGDINKDGVVDAKDVKLALQIAAGLLNANDPTVSFANGNVVADTVINVLDALSIQRKINGK